MRRLALACATLSTLVSAALGAVSTAAAASPEELASSALAALEDAQATYSAGRWQCASDLGPGLAAAADALRSGGGDLRWTRDQLEALADGIDAACQAPLRATLTRLVDRAMVRLEVALGDLGRGYQGGHGDGHRGDRDGDRRDHHGRTETSAVDAQCITTMRDAYPYLPDRDTILEWIAVCRSGPQVDAATATLSMPDGACLGAATAVYPYMLDAGTQAAFAAACTRYESRAAYGTPVDAAVDATCLRQLADGYAYQPSRDVILQWAAACKARPGASCLRTGTRFDAGCFGLAKARYPYQPDRATLRAFADACAAERYVCR